MLPASLSELPDLDVAIEETRRAQGAHGVVDLLVAALTDRRMRRDVDVEAQLGLLKSVCRQTRRYREIVPVLRRVAALNPERRHEMAVETALVHAHVGEIDRAAAVLTSAVAQQRSLLPWKRSLSFAVAAELAAITLGRTELAAECAELGRSSATPAPGRSRPATRRVLAATRPAVAAAGSAVAAMTPNTLAAAAAPARAPSLRRGRAKGPIRQLSVLGASAGGVGGVAGADGPSKLLRLVVAGTAA
jgi:hypothetical protein